MVTALKAGALLLAIYGIYGVITGHIYSQHLVRIDRDEQPFTFWLISLGDIIVGVVIYFVLLNKYG